MLRTLSYLTGTVAGLALLVGAAGCGGGSSDPTPTHSRHSSAPFAAPIDFDGGPSSGLWGDRGSGRAGDELGCIPGRRYADAVTVHNRSSSTVTITGVDGADPAPAIIRRVATQVRLAPPPPGGDAIPVNLRAWSAASLVPLALPAGKAAIVQSDFLMGHCATLGHTGSVTVNNTLAITYRADGRAGHQTLAQRAARIVLTRGPASQPCAAPTGATRLIASDVTCAVAVPTAVKCRRLAHGTYGNCTAASHLWSCTYESTARVTERCWLATKRQSITVRWS